MGRLEINPIERLTRIGCSNHNFSMKETSRVPTLLDVDVDSDNGEEDSGMKWPSHLGSGHTCTIWCI